MPSRAQYRTFVEVQAGLEQLVQSNERDEAERVVRWLVDRAASTKSREHEALAYFARGVLHTSASEYGEAEKMLRVALDIARQLHPAPHHALGMVARSLGVVFGHLDAPEQAVDMFLLARNVFEKTDPELAPEVVRLSAVCFVAVKRYDEALAVVHQSIGSDEEARALTTPEELELCLLRARIFEEQLKPAQALKARALVTRMVTPAPAIRRQVIEAWVQIARQWHRGGQRSGAGVALHCASLVAGEHRGRLLDLVERALRELNLDRSAWGRPAVARVQHRSRDGVVAVGSPVLGLGFARIPQPPAVGAFVEAVGGPGAGFAVRAATKCICGYLVHPEPNSDAPPPPAVEIWGRRREGLRFEVGDEVQVHNGGTTPSPRRVIGVSHRGVALDRSPEWPSNAVLAAIQPYGGPQLVVMVPAGAPGAGRLAGAELDAALRELLT